MPLARRRVPGLAPRGGSRIRTGGDALAAFVLGTLAVFLCSSVIAVLHSSLGANYEALGLVYLPAVIGVAFLFGLRAGVLTAVAAVAVFDLVLLPPAELKTPDSRVWLLFAALLLSRRRRRRARRARAAPLGAGLRARARGGAAGRALERARRRGEPRARAGRCGARGRRRDRRARRRASCSGAGRSPVRSRSPLDVDGRVIGRLELMGADEAVLQDENALRVARSLAGVLALAQERERLAHADVEAEALRHSDALKTALLRAVSHELRTPLTAIKAGVGALRGDQVQLGRGGGARAARGREHRDRPARPPRLRPARRLAPAGRQRVHGARLVRGRRPRARRARRRALARGRTRTSTRRPRTTCRSCAATRRRSSACSST